jgi:hypothetical protein
MMKKVDDSKEYVASGHNKGRSIDIVRKLEVIWRYKK